MVHLFQLDHATASFQSKAARMILAQAGSLFSEIPILMIEEIPRSTGRR
jgi:hypothetical protein